MLSLTHLPLQTLIPLSGADAVAEVGAGGAVPPGFDGQLGTAFLYAVVQQLRLRNGLIQVCRQIITHHPINLNPNRDCIYN